MDSHCSSNSTKGVVLIECVLGSKVMKLTRVWRGVSMLVITVDMLTKTYTSLFTTSKTKFSRSGDAAGQILLPSSAQRTMVQHNVYYNSNKMFLCTFLVSSSL